MPQSTKYILPIYAAFALYSIGYFSVQNGYIDKVLSKQHEWLTQVPTTPNMRPQITGLASLDEALATMFIFYWPILDGSSPGLSLQFFNLFGTMILSSVLFSLESLRKGNRSSSSFFFNPVLWGMISVMATLAISIPWYLFIHLLISTTASHPTSANLSITIHELRALIFKIIFGLVLPSVLVALPETTTQPVFTRQTGIALWQLLPFWAAAVNYIAQKLLPLTEARVEPGLLWEKTRTAFRSVYGLTFAIVAISHIATWTVCLTAAYAVPQLLDDGAIPALYPAAVVLATSPWSSSKVESISEGSLWLLQWDHILGAGAMYWWSFDLYRATHTIQGKRIDWLGFLLKTTAICLFSGPTGAAIELLWEREEMVLEAGRGKEKSQ